MASIGFSQMAEICDQVLSEAAAKNEDEGISSVLLTPDTTPTKTDTNKDVSSPESDENLEQFYRANNTRLQLLHFKEVKFADPSMDSEHQIENCREPCQRTLTRSNSDSILDSPKPTKPKVVRCEIRSQNTTEVKSVGRPPKAGRSKGRRCIQKKSNDGSTAKANERNRSKSVPPKKKPESGNHLVTDYFPVRRSGRVPTSQIKKQQQADIEESILSGSEDGLKVIEFVGKGRGVVASKVFHKGDFVVEYTGDLIELTNAKQREKDYSQNTMIGCYMYYFNFQNKTYCIDATKETGKLGRLLNHSKSSNNCGTRVVPIRTKPYLIIVATRQIEIGEELLYDYGDRSKESLKAHPWLAL